MHGQKIHNSVYTFSMLSELKETGLFNTVRKKKNLHFQQGQNLFIKVFHRNNSAGKMYFKILSQVGY